MNLDLDPERDADVIAWVQARSGGEIVHALRLGIQVTQMQREQMVKQLVHDEIRLQAQHLSGSVLAETQTSLQQHWAPIATKLDELQTSLGQMHTNLQVPSLKGRVGESLVHQAICRHFPDAEFENTSKQAHMSDAHVHLTHGCVMVEVKTYQTNVPTAQVDKFRTEFLQQTKCRAGVFAALTSGIARKRELDYELVDQGRRILVFLPHAGVDGGPGLAFALHFCNLFMQQKHNADSTDIDASPADEQHQRQVERLHQTLAQQSSRAHTLVTQISQFEKHVSNLEKSTREQRTLLTQWREALEQMIQAALELEPCFRETISMPTTTPTPALPNKRNRRTGVTTTLDDIAHRDTIDL